MSLTKFVSGNNVEFSNDNRTVYVLPSSNAKCNNPKTEGKWYFEFEIVQRGVSIIIGMGDNKIRNIYPGSSTHSFGYHINDARLYYNNEAYSRGSNYNTGDILGIGINIDDKKVAYYKNGELNFEFNLENVPEELFIEVGTGGDARTIATLLTTVNEMKYYKNVKDIYKPWDRNDYFLIKQNNEYYSIKPEYYVNGKIHHLKLEGGEHPSEADYESFGFDDVNSLLTTQTIKLIEGVDKGCLGKGKYFELGLDNEIKKIINIEYESENMPNKNLALHRPITSSKEPYGYYTPDKAVDGNLSSDTGFLKSDYGKVSLTIELDDIYLVNKIQLKQLNYGGYRCKNFTVEVSTNDIDYIEVYAGTLVNNNNIQEFILNKCYKCKYFKFNIKDNYIASNKSNGIGEIEIYGVNYKFLLKHSNQFYTFSNSDIVLSPSQELTEANFKINGFDDVTNIEEEQWNNAFPDKIDLRLLMWTDDLDKTKIKAECGVQPYIPYDKLNNEFEICMATEKNGGIS
ncbi:discoidin domain-containing protein [Clostridium cochlearium]|uniref:B30.2/SPRY domain-containing protein n=1 Tax=Clostridium cochlearium TaxID=1494 RepID=A0A7Y3XXW6_CLOCO|nr:discoidin domain-containing protein [Clostridium cochlearium]NOH14887.1 hypothetical protein [Clostridium cochlearium]